MGDWGLPGLPILMALSPQAQQETQKAALRYERAVSMHNAAREMVFVAEQGVMADKNRLDPTWQEMLNHATCKVRGCCLQAPALLPLLFLHLACLPLSLAFPPLWFPLRWSLPCLGRVASSASMVLSLLECLLYNPVPSGWDWPMSSSQAVALDPALPC